MGIRETYNQTIDKVSEWRPRFGQSGKKAASTAAFLGLLSLENTIYGYITGELPDPTTELTMIGATKFATDVGVEYLYRKPGNFMVNYVKNNLATDLGETVFLILAWDKWLGNYFDPSVSEIQEMGKEILETGIFSAGASFAINLGDTYVVPVWNKLLNRRY